MPRLCRHRLLDGEAFAARATDFVRLQVLRHSALPVWTLVGTPLGQPRASSAQCFTGGDFRWRAPSPTGSFVSRQFVAPGLVYLGNGRLDCLLLASGPPVAGVPLVLSQEVVCRMGHPYYFRARAHV